MKHLNVWLTLPTDETVPIGELVFGTPRTNGTAPTAFRYTPAWLTRPDAFALNPDPQSLPLDSLAWQGQAWIAKFPSLVRDNGHDVVGLEAVCLNLAAQAGLSVPPIHLADLGARRV